MRYAKAQLVLLLFTGSWLVLLGHPGGLDSNGGHYDRKSGTYHYHRPASAPPPASKAPKPAEPKAPPAKAGVSAAPNASSQPTSSGSTAVEANLNVGRVVAIHDGDTISILSEDKIMVRIRVYGIDAPESKQAFGSVAKTRASALVMGSTVRYSAKEKDRYGRTVSKVTLPDGTDFGERMILEGMAWHYVQYARNEERYADAQKTAREKKIGLWRDAHPVPPWEFRANPAPVQK